MSVTRTLVPVQAESQAPPNLVPRWSTLSIIDTGSAHPGLIPFTFVDEPPAGIELAGRFAPAQGCVWVEGNSSSMRFWGNVHCLPGRPGRQLEFEGVQIVWVGEFIDRRS